MFKALPANVTLSLFLAAVFLFIGVFMPYFPVWLKAQGFSAAQISLIIGLPIILRIPFTFAAGVSADALGERRLVIIWLMAMLVLAASSLTMIDSFWPVLIAVALMALAAGSIIPITDAITLTEPQAGHARYGRIRLWGSLAFIVGNLICGLLIARHGANVIVTLTLAALILGFLFSLALPKTKRIKTEFWPSLKTHVFEAGTLMTKPSFALMIAIYGLVQSSHGIYYIFSILHWQSLGISTSLAGALWALGVLAEVVLFVFSTWLMIRLGAIGLLAIGAGVGLIRWSVMAFDPPLAILIILQTGHAASFAAAHLGAMRFISQFVPEKQAATAQALLHGIGMGLFSGLVFLSAGFLYTRLGAHAFGVMALLCVAGLVLTGLLNRIWDRGEIALKDR